MPNNVFILSHHRAGSSLAAKTLYESMSFSDQDFLGRSEFNVGGHYEDLNFLNISKDYFSITGQSWFIKDIIKDQNYFHALEKYQQFINNKNYSLFKDPSFSIFAADLEFSPSDFVLLVRRSKSEIHKSIANRNLFNDKDIDDVIDFYDRRIKIARHDGVVDYSDLGNISAVSTLINNVSHKTGLKVSKIRVSKLDQKDLDKEKIRVALITIFHKSLDVILGREKFSIQKVKRKVTQLIGLVRALYK